MKTVFIINSHAGQGISEQKITDTIKSTCADADIYITRGVGDATEFVKDYCEKNGAARFIACGGDGTLSEVINGAIGVPGVQTGVMPMGTGNDFCRNFPGADFANYKAQITSPTQKCDVIKYTAETDDGIKHGYCVNMVNIGFDCNVAVMTAHMKTKPLISGSMAYFVSILVNLIEKRGADLFIELDGKPVHNGKLLLTSIANGCFCGGGIKSNPQSLTNDGLININIIKNVTRLRFLTLLPYYMKGTHEKLRGIDKIIVSEKHRHIKITPAADSVKICIDGEISSVRSVEFEIVPEAFDFVVPKANCGSKPVATHV